MSATTLAPKALDLEAERLVAELESLPLVESDGVPMESHWHFKCTALLIEQIEEYLQGRTDFYVGGNMFIYFSPEQARNKEFRGPDFFFVWDTNREPMRKYWVVWDEGLKTPDVVIELLSSSTRQEDLGPKLRIYRDTLKVGNYFVFDPDQNVLEGWRLEKKKYVRIRPDERGRLYCDELELFLGSWPGVIGGNDAKWLRFFDKDGRMLPVPTEQAKAERLRAEAEKARAEAEKARAETETNRAEVEKARADAAEAEIARLKASLSSSSPPGES